MIGVLHILKSYMWIRNYCVNCLTIWKEDDERWADLLKSKSDAINDWECFLCLVKQSAGRKAKRQRRGKNILKAHANWPQKVVIVVIWCLI